MAITAPASGAGSERPLPSGDHARFAVWALVGLVAQVAFMAAWTVAETWQGSRYSPVRDTISDLQAATAPHVWFPIACFAAGGLGTFCFAVFGLRPALAGAGKVASHAPWVLGLSTLALGNSFPLIPCRLADPGCTVHRQLSSPGGLTDAIVAGVALSVLAFTPAPLWQRLSAVPGWGVAKFVLRPARVACPLLFLLLVVASFSGTDQGLAERALVTSCVLWVGALVVALLHVSRKTRLLVQ